MFNFWWLAEWSEQWKLTKMHHQSGSERLKWPILPDSQLFQSFPTKVAQDNSEWPILHNLQLFQSFPTEVAQNDSKWPIFPDSQLFQSFPTEVAQDDSELPILHGQKKKKKKKKHNYTREFLWKITLLHGQLCHKPYGFLVLWRLTCQMFAWYSQ